MMYFAIALFALSAVLGLAILLKWLGKKDASRAVVYSHGAVAATGLVVLVVYAIMNPAKFPMASIALFAVAAVFGFYMFFNDLKKKMSPLSVALIHAGLAVAGFAMLLVFVFA